MNLDWWNHYHLAIDNIQFAPDCAAVAAIVVHPADIATPQGAKAMFACGVKGDPAPTVSWYHLGSLLGSDGFSGDSGRIWMSDDNSLMFNSTVAADAGTYTCNATNTIGFKVSSAQLVILDVSQYLTWFNIPIAHFKPLVFTHKSIIANFLLIQLYLGLPGPDLPCPSI